MNPAHDDSEKKNFKEDAKNVRFRERNHHDCKKRTHDRIEHGRTNTIEGFTRSNVSPAPTCCKHVSNVGRVIYDEANGDENINRRYTRNCYVPIVKESDQID